MTAPPQLGLNHPTVSRDVGVLGVFTFALAVLAYLLADYRTAVFVRELPRPLRDLASQLTEFGQMGHYVWILPLAIIVSVLLKRKTDAWWFGLALASTVVSGLLVNILKIILGRSRPSVLFAYNEYGFGPIRLGYDHASFPSGHAATCGSLAAVLWLKWPRLWPLWLILGLTIAFTRVFTLSHYISDVLIGAYLGAVTTLLLHREFVRRKWL